MKFKFFAELIHITNICARFYSSIFGVIPEEGSIFTHWFGLFWQNYLVSFVENGHLLRSSTNPSRVKVSEQPAGHLADIAAARRRPDRRGWPTDRAAQ